MSPLLALSGHSSRTQQCPLLGVKRTSAARRRHRNILLALLSSLAKVETQKISERTKAGTARAKAKGIKVGRPKLGLELRQMIARRAAKGGTPYSIAKTLGIDRLTAVKYARSTWSGRPE
jgi:DNA invertase Pin-like site-specific DNA recombinase